MTTEDPPPQLNELRAEPSEQPPAPKLDPNDPRLRLRRGRTLRLGPVLALVAVLGTVAALALVVALEPGEQSSDAVNGPELPKAPQPAVIPEDFRDPPPEVRSPPPPTDRLPVTPLPSDAELAAYQVGAAGPYSPARQRELQHEEAHRARSAGVFFENTAAPAVPGGELAPAPPARPGGHPSQQPALPIDGDPNAQQRKNAFLNGAGSSNTSDYLTATLQPPASPYQVQAGTIIPGVLISGINSDLPGPVIAQVRENVYDTVSGNYLLVPQGARLLANYDSLVAWGQERVLVCWNRLIFPNGYSINLECMPAADLAGYAGLADEVDEHWGRLLKGAAIASLLAATTQAVAGNTTGFNPTVPQMWARNAAAEVNQIGQQITRRNLNIQPTITVRPGFSVNVVVTKDMILPPYSEAP